jgi:trehalose 2-sulfotransferase
VAVRHHRPTRFIVIASTARTGSTLLNSALYAAGVFGTRVEHLNPPNFAPHLRGLARVRNRLLSPNVVVSRSNQRSVRSAFRRVARANTTTDGVFGLKVMWGDLSAVLHRHGLDLDVLDLPITWIRISRIDRVGQAVSWARAEQTGRWTHSAVEREAPRYDGQRIAQLYATIAEEERCWDGYFQTHHENPHMITYEELDAKYESVVRGVLDHIGSTDTPVPARQLERQADGLNVEWVQRFRDEHGL